MKIYIAGKVAKDSHFGKHHWRQEFCDELSELSGIDLVQLDPLAMQELDQTPQDIFAKDCRLIQEADIVVVYLSDDISVGGSQEILIARYLGKPVIGLAPHGGKFNGARREMLGTVIEDYKDPFVFATCDVVCGTVEEVAKALLNVLNTPSTGLSIIDTAVGMDTVAQHIACKALIVRDGTLLMMRESPITVHSTNTNVGKYEFPGGKIKLGEPYLEGLAREINEETGLTVTIGGPIHVDEWYPVVRGQRQHIVGIFFVCEYARGEVILSDEHDDYQWLSLEEIDTSEALQLDKTIAKKYFASLS